MSRYTQNELRDMATEALNARTYQDPRWMMLCVVLCEMFQISESELVSRLEQLL